MSHQTINHTHDELTSARPQTAAQDSMNNASPLARAAALLARLDDSATPARSMTRASAKLASLAARSPRGRAFYWLSQAVNDHKHVMLSVALNEGQHLVAAHTVRRDRAISLFARRHAQQL